MAAPMSLKTCRTLFIRNLPYTANDKKLQNLFSDGGSVKQCFVVKVPGRDFRQSLSDFEEIDHLASVLRFYVYGLDLSLYGATPCIGSYKEDYAIKQGSDKCKGFGYVQFVLLNDAVSAQKKTVYLDGRQLFLSFADINKKKGHGKQPKITAPAPEASSAEETVETSKPTTSKVNVKEDPRYLKAKTLVVTGFSDGITEQRLHKTFQKFNVKNISKLQFPVSGHDTPTAFLRFKCIRDTKRALRRLEVCNIKGNMIKAVQLSKDVNKPVSAVKRNRLIVRNLSFKCSEEVLKKSFSKFGDISEVIIPVKSDGKMYGFGFVQYSDIVSANAALKAMNAKQLLGRTVAVDWAVPKTKYQASLVKKEKNDNDPAVASDEGSFSTEDGSSDDQDSDTDSSEDEGFQDDKKVTSKRRVSDSDSEESDNDDMDDDEEEEDEESDEDDEESDENDEESDDENGDKDVNKKKQKPKTRPVKEDRGVKEGKTIFIRNVPFDAEDEDLEEMFEQHGEIQYCRVVYDPDTGHPKGSAFIQFKSKESANTCLSKADSTETEGGFVLRGRRLNISSALDRGDIQRKKDEEKESKAKLDKRNLHLAREGMVRSGTQEAIGLSQSDLDRRSKMDQDKRVKLKNPNMFISSVRLSVHNLPHRVTDTELRAVFLKAAGTPKAKIMECRVMRDMQQLNAQGQGRSLGFAFIAFKQHDHALQALRKVNNNAEVFGEAKRPIVAFSLENRQALETKQRRMERSVAKQATLNKTKAYNKTNEKKPPVKPAAKELIAPVRAVDGKKAPKGLPSHWGAKVRHKKRGEQQQQPEKKGRKFTKPEAALSTGKRKNTPPQESQAPSKKKRKHRGHVPLTDNFDKMVNTYKQRLLAATQKQKGGDGKWFDG